MQTALDWKIEGYYARYIDGTGKCRAMVRVDPVPVEAYEQYAAEAIKEARS